MNTEPTGNPKSTVWRIRNGADRRFRTGHPWVYSNELADSPKGVEPGAPVELRDASGKFLARGYGNPHSLISFRTLSRNAEITDPGSVESLRQTLLQASRLRRIVGLADVSHRWIFGEADGLPGLIMDRFRTGAKSQVISIQAHTAGADRLTANIIRALESISNSPGETPWSGTSIILRNDLSIRKLEGITERTPEVFKSVEGTDYSNLDIEVAAVTSSRSSLTLRADLLKGQKTGFFLDQFANIQLAATRLQQIAPQGRPVRLLDLCCYVGQWSAQLARVLLDAGHPVEVVAVDASNRALELARENVERQARPGGPALEAKFLRMDVLKDLPGLEPAFDLIISDPPALIQGRKDIPAGTHAYLQLNTQVFRLIRPGGAVVSCSCSGLLNEEDFVHALGKAAYRNRQNVRWIGRGSQSPDHPMLTEFPEGRYLKCWIGIALPHSATEDR